jgi:hypothetical protein
MSTYFEFLGSLACCFIAIKLLVQHRAATVNELEVLRATRLTYWRTCQQINNALVANQGKRQTWVESTFCPSQQKVNHMLAALIKRGFIEERLVEVPGPKRPFEVPEYTLTEAGHRRLQELEAKAQHSEGNPLPQGR